MLYDYEMTDTFAGEANYCWIKRGTVKASSFTGAIRAAKRQVDWLPRRHRVDMRCGDMVRIVAKGAPICMFITWHDDSRDA
jgi:hypothetical protein